MNGMAKLGCRFMAMPIPGLEEVKHDKRSLFNLWHVIHANKEKGILERVETQIMIK